MPRIAILFGALLIILGLVGYFAPDVLGDPGEKTKSLTALIPAGVGAILLVCGVMGTLQPGARKHVMHLAAAIGLLGALGGVMPLMRSKFDFSKASAVSGLLMILLCAIFVILCVRSFIRARIARAANLPESQRME
jgi:Ca2+/Na+ antiporter